MIVTDRDRQVLRFLSKWRFGTAEQLKKAGIYSTGGKRCYNRMLEMCKAGLIKSGQLASGVTYYHLLPLGGEIIGLDYPWYNRLYKGAGDTTVVQYLIYCDYALALGIDYISSREVFEQLYGASYDALKKVVRSQDKFYSQGGALHALVVDFGLSMKYLTERAGAYARLPHAVRGGLVVVFLVFNDVKNKAVTRAVKGPGLNLRVLKSKWKY